MKKYIFLIIIILLSGCVKKPVYQTIPVKDRSATLSLTNINVGTTPNDGTGQTIRSAFQTINTNNDLTEAAIATVPTITEVRGEINDTIDNLKELAVPLSNVAWTKADTTYTYKKIITFNQLQSALSGISGGTGSSTTPALQFIVGKTSGAPANGDSSFYHTDLIDTDIILYRGTTADMHRQYYNATARNGYTGYRISNDSIIVRPALATNDRILVEARDMEYATFGTNSLLTGLMGYWAMEEASGTTISDAHSTNVDGTATAGLSYHATGAINYGLDFNGTSTNIAFGTSCRPTAGLSVSLWFNTADITTEQMLVGNTYYGAGGWTGYRVSVASDGSITFIIGTGTATLLDKSYSSGLDNATMHHVVCTWNGSSAYVYVDNVKSPASIMSTAAAYDANGTLRFGSNFDATTMFFGGIMDEVAIFSRALTDAEVTILYNKTAYPFN